MSITTSPAPHLGRPLVITAWIAAALAAAPLAPPQTPETAPATVEMGRLLQEQAAKVDPIKLGFIVNDRRADLLAAQLEKARSGGERLSLRFAYAAELIYAGRFEAALEACDALEADARANAPAAWQNSGAEVGVLRALAHLRLAEEQNCHQVNTRDSCLLPLRGEGIHKRRDAGTAAVKVLESVLEATPDHLTARWLLNVAAMTVGRYPDGVPARHLIPPSAFASEYALPRFDNVAKDAGLDVYGLSGGAIMDDFDDDGLLDVVLSAIPFDAPLRYFGNRGDGSFEERSRAAGFTGETGGLNLLQADYDNDGALDVLVLRGAWMRSEGRFPLSLLKGDGKGRFADVTVAAGLLRFGPTQAAAWLDYDGDGWLDLFVGNESAPEGSPKELVHRCELFRNNRNGTFTEVSAEAGIDVVAYVKGVVSGDYDNDGRPDLYVSILGEPNRLFHNDGPKPGGGWRFTEVAGRVGVTQPEQSFGAFFFDYDNDSWLDLFVTGYGLPPVADVAADYLGLPTATDRGRLYRNRGDGTFEDVTKAAGLYRVIPAMGLNFGDLDNDSFLDMYLGTGTPDLAMQVPNRMFRNDGGKRFQDVTTAGNFGHIQKGHGVSFGDIDNDGDQDVLEEMGGAYLVDKAHTALYRNPGNENRWLSLELEGVRTNRRAIGARVAVTVDGPSGSRAIHRVVGSGGSFGASPLRVEVGLGPATRILSVDVLWPASGERQKLKGLEPNRRYRIREGSTEAVAIKRPTFELAGTAPSSGPGPASGR